MSFENRYRKHKTFIENRWQPIDVKVLSEEDPKKKVSIIEVLKWQRKRNLREINRMLT